MGGQRWSRTVRDDRHRRRPGRASHRLPPGPAGPAVRDPRRRPAGRRLLARALGLASALHPGPLQSGCRAWPSRPRSRTTPPRTRWPTTSRPTRRPSTSRPYGVKVDAGRRSGDRSWSPPGSSDWRPSIRGRDLGRLPLRRGAPLRRRARPGHPPASLQRLPAPIPAPRGGVLVVGAATPGPRSPSSWPVIRPGFQAGDPARSRRGPGPAGPAADPAIWFFISQVLTWTRRSAGRLRAQSDPGRHSPGPGQAAGHRRRRDRTGAPHRRGRATASPCWRTEEPWMWRTSSGPPATGPISPGSAFRFHRERPPGHDREGGRRSSPASTSWALLFLDTLSSALVGGVGRDADTSHATSSLIGPSLGETARWHRRAMSAIPEPVWGAASTYGCPGPPGPGHPSFCSAQSVSTRYRVGGKRQERRELLAQRDVAEDLDRVVEPVAVEARRPRRATSAMRPSI